MKLTEKERNLAEAIERIFKSKDGQLYKQLEEVYKARILAQAIRIDHKLPEYGQEMAYFKGKIDAINDLENSRDQYIRLLHDKK